MGKENKRRLKKWTSEITKFHPNECLENAFSQATIIPSLNEKITKRA